MDKLHENVKRQMELYWRCISIFDGIGFDFSKFSEYVNSDTQLVNLDGYNAFLDSQIQQIESKIKREYAEFERMLIKTPLEDYASLLFVILSNVDENCYHPMASYKYKYPNAKQKKLIRQMLQIYPFSDEWIEDEFGFRHLHQVDAPDKVNNFSFSISGYKIRIADYEQQKFFFQILSNEYKAQGLNHCYPYGENYAYNSAFDYPICERHLTKQLVGKRGGGNKIDFKRELMYRLSYLLSIDKLYKEPFDGRLFWHHQDECARALEHKKPSCKDARLIADILEFFDIYKAGSYGRRDSRIISLMAAGHPNSDIANYILANHPSVIRFFQKMSDDSKLQEETLWHMLWNSKI